MNQVTSSDGTVIAYERSGEGAPVILIGGALSDRRAAAPLVAALSPHLGAVAYDRRGRGDSGDTQPYAVEREIDDLDALIGDLGGAVVVYGHSSGAAIALEAVARGLAISRMAVFEPPFRVEGSPRLPEGYLERLTALTSSGHGAEAVELFMREAVGLPAEAIARTRAAPEWSALEALAHTVRYDSLLMGEGTLPTDRLARVTIPTLVLASTGSPAWLQHAADATAAGIAGAQRSTLEGVFHSVPPDTLAPVLVSFLTT